MLSIYPEVKHSTVVLLKCLFNWDNLPKDFILEGQRADRCQKPAVTCLKKYLLSYTEIRSAQQKNIQECRKALTKHSLTKVKPGEPIKYEGWIKGNFLRQNQSRYRQDLQQKIKNLNKY